METQWEPGEENARALVWKMRIHVERDASMLIMDELRKSRLIV